MKSTIIAALLAGLCMSSVAGGAEEEVSRNWVRFQSWGQDSLELYSSYYPAAPSRLPIVLLLHDRGGDGSDFGALATHMVRAGMPVFLPDLRGEGQSTASRGGRVRPAPSWGAAEQPLLRKDLEGVFSFASAQESLRDRGWVIIAEGEAAGIALDMAESDPRLSGMVLLSPLRLGRQFRLQDISIPVLLFACESDTEAAETVRGLYAGLAPELCRMDLMPCSSRGHRMLKWVGNLKGSVTDWALQLGGKPR